MLKFENKNIIITGASRGIGLQKYLLNKEQIYQYVQKIQKKSDYQ